MQAVADARYVSPRVIAFPLPMAKPKPKSAPPKPEPIAPWNTHWYGNLAQWVAPLITLIIGIVMVSLQVHYRNADSSSKGSDEHINSLIDAKLSPILSRLDALSDKINDAEGQLKRLRNTPEAQKHTEVLTSIRTKIGTAATQRIALSPAQMADYKKVLKMVPKSADEYWTTVAAIINYQSLLNQINGDAPDPANISKPCRFLTNQGRLHSFNNTFIGVPISNCVVDLDSQSFSDVTFNNSVVRYHGGKTFLSNVQFVNCRFVLDISASTPASPERDRLLMTLLNAPEIKSVKISSTGS